MTTTLSRQSFRYFTELPDNPHRTGRHQVHDVLDALPGRQLENVVDLFASITTVTHQEHEPVFDQGQIGSCTANAGFGTMVTGTADAWAVFQAAWKRHGRTGPVVEDDCVQLYELETSLDNSQIPGQYPPDDTGSSGPWSMMSLERWGLIRSFHHTRSLRTALVALNDSPVSIGIPWLQSMFDIDSSGTIIVDQDSQVAGGHQVCLVANDTSRRAAYVRNSWGTNWGQSGHAWLSWDSLKWLFAQGGDAVRPVL
jgi:hypothetical protein